MNNIKVDKNIELTTNSEGDSGIYDILIYGVHVGNIVISKKTSRKDSEILYNIDKHYQGNGYCVLAVRAVTEEFLKNGMKLEIKPLKIKAVYEVSSHVAEKSGYIQDPRTRNYFLTGIDVSNKENALKQYKERLKRIDDNETKQNKDNIELKK